MQGSWIAISADGKDLPAGVHIGLTVTGDKYREVHDGRLHGSGTVKVDASKKPAWLDFVITEGPEAGQTQLCLLEAARRHDDDGPWQDGERTAAGVVWRRTPSSIVKLKPLPATLEGTWTGVLEASSGPLRLSITLTNGPDGLATGTLTSVDQGNRTGPIFGVLVRGARLTFILPEVRGGFDGELKDGQLSGTWTQPRVSRPLVFKRSTSVLTASASAIAADRPALLPGSARATSWCRCQQAGTMSVLAKSSPTNNSVSCAACAVA